MDAIFHLTPVAFVHSTGGTVRVLLAVDRDGSQLFDGEPVLLAEHRPGASAEGVVVEGADRIAAASVQFVRARSAAALAALVDEAHDELGQFDGQRLLGQVVTVVAPVGCFDE